MRRIFFTAFALLLAALAGASYGSVIGFRDSDEESYHDVRLQIISAHLRQISDDYIVVMGDSHAESWFSPTGCKLPIVNAGFAGATAESYSRFFARLPLPRPPRAIIMTIGTNDAQSRRIKDPDAAVAAYEHTVEALLKRAAEQANLVIVTAVPPLDPKRAVGFSREAALRFSSVLKNTCSKRGCRFVDPFRERTELFNGVHLVDYAKAYASIWDDICPAIDR